MVLWRHLHAVFTQDRCMDLESSYNIFVVSRQIISVSGFFFFNKKMAYLWSLNHSRRAKSCIHFWDSLELSCCLLEESVSSLLHENISFSLEETHLSGFVWKDLCSLNHTCLQSVSLKCSLFQTLPQTAPSC